MVPPLALIRLHLHPFAARCHFALARGVFHVDGAQSRCRHCRAASMLISELVVLLRVIVERVGAPRVDVVWDGNSGAFTF